ncbi:MAG: hypothetical protein KKD63_14395 [Proteobacteria bacterium]|nr:hypothetical protein [Desulfobulbaceae bacterium]MBU4154059.1 hypothetical protein [Pseudomonadota bacterium]MDP2105995.1 hypothetical protein [Desulfobulbaceae bacterium]
MKQRKKTLSPPGDEQTATPYEPTPFEREATETYLAAQKAKMPEFKVRDGKNGRHEISLDHPAPKWGEVTIMNACATTSYPFMEVIICQLSNAMSKGEKPDEAAINFALDVIKGVKPKDQVETLLAVQMAAIHMATMTFARRLAHVETITQQDSAERALNKLARTFTTQMETLKRYRTGGEQKVTVHHVTVNEGGQAIVGNVERLGGGEG